MKPGFALSLSFEGITLLFRSATGWRTVGEIRVDRPDLDQSLAALRRSATALAPEGILSKVVIPNDQIRYLTVETGDVDEDTRRQRVRAALDSATPYGVDELSYDMSADGKLTHVAAVAHETLDEAEAFAVNHRFNPVSFVAVPDDTPFLGEPFFGVASHAATMLAPGETIERDDDQIRVVGKAEAPTPRAPAETADAPLVLGKDAGVSGAAPLPGGDNPPTPEPSAKDVEQAPAQVAGFTSRRGRKRPEKEVAAPELPGVTRDPEPAAISPEIRIPAAPPPSEDTFDDSLPPWEDESLAEETFADVEPPLQDDPLPPSALAASLLAGSGPASSDAGNGFGNAEAGAAPSAAIPDETQRMTIFGMRTEAADRVRPRYMGLVLTALLLVLLAGIAAWAAVFVEDGIAGLFGRSEPTEIAAPERPAPEATPLEQILAVPPVMIETQSEDDPTADAAPAPVAALTDEPVVEFEPPLIETGDTPAAPPSLSDTDIAVLDALGQTQPDPEPETDPSPEETAQTAIAEATYAATGIWQNTPESPETPGLIGLDDLYVASIDRATQTQDALALPTAASFDTDISLAGVSSPAEAGTEFELDALGLVEPTPEGTLNPDGVFVYLGKPKVIPPATPKRFATEPDPDPALARLPKKRPRSRPADLVEQAERSRLGGLTRAELGQVRPKTRPDTIKAPDTDDEAFDQPTARAIAASRPPKSRPSNFARTVAAAKPDRSPVPAAASVAPKIPTAASVARQATMENAINLSKVNLIGVYGTPSNRRALVRLSSGRYKKVKVGDRIDGGKVVAIGDSELRYTKSGRNLVLRIPSG